MKGVSFFQFLNFLNKFQLIQLDTSSFSWMVVCVIMINDDGHL